MKTLFPPPLIFIVFLTISWNSLHAQLVINEISYRNINQIADHNKKYPDWVELFNAGEKTINMANYSLENESDKKTYQFPNQTLGPKEHMVVFATPNQQSDTIFNWHFQIGESSNWKYLNPDEELNPNWFKNSFNDSNWQEGQAGFGYGDGDDKTVVESDFSIYVRHEFNLEKPELIERLVFAVDYDDAVVAYLNGRAFYFGNLRKVSGHVKWGTKVLREREARMYRNGNPSFYHFPIKKVDVWLKKGSNVLAIQVINNEVNSSDMSLRPYLLTAKKPNSKIASTNIPALWEINNARFHVPFGLSSGETIILRKNGEEIDRITIPSMPENFSWARVKDGKSRWMFFDHASPEKENQRSNACGCFGKKVNSNMISGFYKSAFSVALSGKTKRKFDIRYTLDGSEPSSNSQLYTGPIQITENTVLKAKTFSKKCLPSKTNTWSYFVNESISLPVVSLVADPDLLFGETKGIYQKGINADDHHPFKGANFYEKWEVPVHFSLYEQEKLVFQQKVGLRINGGGSRTKKMKSLRLTARDKYSKSKMKHPFFENRDKKAYKKILLKNSGQNFGAISYQDALLQQQVEKLGNMHTQAYRPVVVFINGKYWGIHNMREKYDEHYLAETYDKDKEDFDILAGVGHIVLQGSKTSFATLTDYLFGNDMSDSVHFSKIEQELDLASFTDYFIVNLYNVNNDWTRVNNNKIWRHPEIDDGKWQFFLVDMDLTMGRSLTKGRTAIIDSNQLAFVNGTNYMFFYMWKRLMRNDQYQEYFVKRYEEALHTIFEPENMIAEINSLQAEIDAELRRHFMRWNLNYSKYLEKDLPDLMDFVSRRPKICEKHLDEWLK